MIYNSEVGKIYDTIFFFIEYFNSKEIEKKYIKFYDDTSFMTNCYQQIRKSIQNIPDFLYPLFYIKDDIVAPLTAFFTSQIDFERDTIDTFLKKIAENQNLLYRCMINHLFHNDATIIKGKTALQAITENYIEFMQALDFPPKFKFLLSLLYGDFNYAVTTLIALLKETYQHVDDLYRKYQKEISMRFEQISSESNIRLYNHALQYDEVDYGRTIVSISLLNQYVVYGPLRVKERIYMLLGYAHEEALGDHFEDSVLSVEEFFICCGNQISLKIIRALKEYKELTVSQLSGLIGYPITTILRHMNILSGNGIIYISKREGLQIFYKINIKLYKRMQINMNESFDTIIKSLEARL